MSYKKINKLMVKIIKSVTEGKGLPTCNDLKITQEQANIIRIMKNADYLNAKFITVAMDNSIRSTNGLDLVTVKGIQFLENKRKISKFFQSLKELIGTIKP